MVWSKATTKRVYVLAKDFVKNTPPPPLFLKSSFSDSNKSLETNLADVINCPAVYMVLKLTAAAYTS